MADTNSSSSKGSRPAWTPMQIAEHRLFTAREKLDLLNKIKDEVRHSVLSSTELGFEPSEIDEAIGMVHRAAESGARVRTVIWGDN